MPPHVVMLPTLAKKLLERSGSKNTWKLAMSFKSTQNEVFAMQSADHRSKGLDSDRNEHNNEVSEKGNEEDLNLLFKKFCESSTIHGTYFWTESR